MILGSPWKGRREEESGRVEGSPNKNSKNQTIAYIVEQHGSKKHSARPSVFVFRLYKWHKSRNQEVASLE